MSDVTIRLRYNLKTGKKDVLIDLVSEPDSLPIEHEQDHRRIVEELVGKGALEADDVGEVEVRRVAPERAESTAGEQADLEEGQAEAAGGHD